jgi:hypothetical protein
MNVTMSATAISLYSYNTYDIRTVSKSCDAIVQLTFGPIFCAIAYDIRTTLQEYIKWQPTRPERRALKLPRKALTEVIANDPNVLFVPNIRCDRLEVTPLMTAALLYSIERNGSRSERPLRFLPFCREYVFRSGYRTGPDAYP